MSDIDKGLELLNSELATCLKAYKDKKDEIDRVLRLRDKYPDLERQVGRWGKVTYSSKSVNTQVTNFDQRFNCGCCIDTPLEIYPYVKTADGAVYSNPACFTVGERHWVSGATPYPGWVRSMRGDGIPEVIIEGVRAYFDECMQDRIDCCVNDTDPEEELSDIEADFEVQE